MMVRRFDPGRVARGVPIVMLLIGTAWLAFSAAATRALPAATLLQHGALFARDPEVVLANATRALVERHGVLPPATLAAVRRAASEVPLDARPYLILGHQALLDRDNRRALALLEAGQRLDPRQRLIHVLLLDRYLRENQYGKAGAQFAVLARLVSQVQAQTATLLAQMVLQPETRAATLRTLRDDPSLERQVLQALARTELDPATLFAIASPAATATAAQPDGWGTALLQRLTAAGRLPAAKRVWRRLYAIPEVRADLPLYDPKLEGWRGGAPFNWTLASSSIGAVDRQNGGMAIEYYGRNSGPLAAQSLTLSPGRYRFALSASSTGSTTAADALAWTLTCAGEMSSSLFSLPLTSLDNHPRRFSSTFVVPVRCAGQQLSLVGTAAEFATTTRAAVSNLTMTKIGG